MTETIENFFLYGSAYGSIIPLLAFLSYFLFREKKIVFLILIAYCFVELLTNYLALHVTDARTFRIIYATFTVLEFSLISACFTRFIHKTFFQRIAICLVAAFAVFAIIYAKATKFKGTDTIPIGVETILILIFSFYFLYIEMEKDLQVLIYNRYTFWIVAGIMLYLSGSLFIYVFADRIEESAKNQFWMFANAFTMLKYLFFVISVFVANRSLKPKTNLYYPI